MKGNEENKTETLVLIQLSKSSLYKIIKLK